MRGFWKRVSSLCLVVMLMLALTACGAQDNATKAFETMMQALQTGEPEQVKNYYDFEAAAEAIVAENRDELETAILKILTKMRYEVLSAEKEDGSHVKVRAKVQTIDFSETMNRFVAQVMSMVSDEAYQARVSDMSREEYQTLMVQQMITVLAQEDIPVKETTVTVNMVKDGGTWKMESGQDDFINSMFANLANAVTSLV